MTPRTRLLLAAPLLTWMLCFLVAPLVLVVAYSFLRRGAYGGVVFELSFANYVRLADPLYLRIYGQSLGLAATAAAVCLAVGLPLALTMARAPERWRALLMAALMLPFLSNFVVRAYAIKALLAHVDLTASPLAVWIGMVTSYLPFMVLPLYASLARFDFTLVEAAYDLGATDWQALTRVLLPGVAAGAAAGTILVFIPALGEFLIPDLLGGARTMLLGNLISDQFLKARDWPFGAALVVTLVAALGLGYCAQRFVTPRGLREDRA